MQFVLPGLGVKADRHHQGKTASDASALPQCLHLLQCCLDSHQVLLYCGIDSDTLQMIYSVLDICRDLAVVLNEKDLFLSLSHRV